MQNRKILPTLILALTVAPGFLLSSCAPVTATRGNYIELWQIEEIAPGKNTKDDVLHILGSPTTIAPFDDRTWYYLGQNTARRGVFSPEIVDEKIVMVRFAKDGHTVEEIRNIDPARGNIEPTGEETPTYGNETTVFQQFFGNLGRFNVPQE